MFMRKTLFARACALAVGLNFLGVTAAVADPSDCTETAIGGQTGSVYTLIGQSEVTETRTFTLDAGGGCGLGAGTEVTYEETYNVGTYTNGTQTVRVNCSTGQVIS